MTERMTERMKRCLELALEAGGRVEEYTDGTFAVVIEVAGVPWRLVYEEQNDWIAMYCPLVRLPQSPDVRLLKGVLQANLELVFMRYARKGEVLCLRGEVSAEEFDPDEYRYLTALAIDAVKAGVQAFGFVAPAEDR